MKNVEKLKMSILIDNLVEGANENKYMGNNGLWYAAKPIFNYPLPRRIRDSIMVLLGKRIAVHYKIDVERKL